MTTVSLQGDNLASLVTSMVAYHRTIVDNPYASAREAEHSYGVLNMIHNYYVWGPEDGQRYILPELSEDIAAFCYKRTQQQTPPISPFVLFPLVGGINTLIFLSATVASLNQRVYSTNKRKQYKRRNG